MNTNGTPTGNGGANVNYTVKELLAQMDLRIAAQHTAIRADLESMRAEIRELNAVVDTLQQESISRKAATQYVNRLYASGLALFAVILNLPAVVYYITVIR